VAAPTAGLHFTERLAGELAARGISFHTVTLHVGAGTFLPVKVDDLAGHKMHAEWGQVSDEVAHALNAARRPGPAGVPPPPPYPPPRAGEGRVGAGGRDTHAPRIVAVGSTSLRLLESAAREDGTIVPFAGDTSLFITPGYRFRAVDVLLTNFHLPRSTLFMLVAAFSGLDTMKRAYAHAVEKGYRFYSYGDACLLFRTP
jgi:S-adenosylmethionine:tRNA ribosyltransferase-isomerase